MRSSPSTIPPARRYALFAAVLAAAMAGGGWFLRAKPAPESDGARDQRRRPPERAPGFRDAAVESGLDFRMRFLPGEQGETFKINLYDHGCGVVIGDVDGDGHDDVYFLNQLGGNALYRNRGDGTFENVTNQSGDAALEGRICVGGTFADYDNDGDQDLFVTTTRTGNVLLRNGGKGRFEEATEEAGLSLVAHSQTAAFLDYDGDGDLDLLVTNSARWTTETFDETAGYYVGLGRITDLFTSPKEYNVLYRNQGDGTFTDVTGEAGVPGQGWGGDVAAFDFDEDGRLDLFVSNMFGGSQLYRNLGGGRFVDVSATALGRTSFGAIGAKAFDYNNDGRLDLLVTDMHSDMWIPFEAEELVESAKKYPYLAGRLTQIDPLWESRERKAVERLNVQYDQVLFGNTLYRNEGNGRFTEVSEAAGVETFWPWGVATGDFDNDGWEDAFFPSGMGYPYFYWRNFLLMNQGDGTFADRSHAEGIEPPADGRYLPETIHGRKAARSSRCAATADFDGDGRLDLVVNNFNDRPYYFRNQFPRRNYVAFRLTGTQSNRDAIGAVVELHLGREVLLRQVHCAGGYLSQSSKTLHFGLGGRTRIDRAEIRWPSGLRQALEEPAVNQLHRITEPEAGP